ncbi:MAG TPA: thioredoxin domain-containing protein [Candidatus Polarisedimenticolia bacterium]|nr:thioredoxin domain-containing protein [Candidatus Polarisedimenticolia bacterium]
MILRNTLILIALAGALVTVPRTAAAADAPAITDIADIKEIDFTGLTEGQKKMALRVMNANGCNCACNKTVAQCRRDMPNSCRRSLIFARTVVDAIREGKDEAAVTKTLEAKAATFIEAKMPDDTGMVYNIDVTNSPVRGPKTASVRIVEFSDFQCPYCAEVQKTLEQVLKAFPKDVQLVYKQYPLNIHPYARQAAAAALYANSQGKFWELHDRMFQNFSAINDQNIRKWVGEVGLNTSEFDRALQTGKFEPVIQKDAADGAAAKVLGTPTIFVNGKRVQDRSFEGFKKMIQEELAGQRAGGSAGASQPSAGAAH